MPTYPTLPALQVPAVPDVRVRPCRRAAVPVVRFRQCQPCQPSNHPKLTHTALNGAFSTLASRAAVVRVRPLQTLPTLPAIRSPRCLGVIRSPC
ncbi:hypothetical protein [Microcoleus sp. B9-D4]|uniref:hypothetical protein n=1 Tax=Microcoleus sp. B9-D4 TaxID=2818711 RepID=UPI002FD0BBD8